MTGGGLRAGRREWVGLAVLALPAFVIALDFSVLNLAVPVISRELMPTATQLLWIVDIYGFVLAGFLETQWQGIPQLWVQTPGVDGTLISRVIGRDGVHAQWVMGKDLDPPPT